MSERSPLVCDPSAPEECGLCRDTAQVGTAVTVDAATGTATVRVGRETVAVALDLLDDVRAGDALLITQGFAVARVGP